MRAARCSSGSFFSDTFNFMRADLMATITEDVGLILNSPIQPGMISREHARLEFVFEHAHWKLVDMNSMNGCLYNGVRVKESKLSGKIPTHFPIHWSPRPFCLHYCFSVCDKDVAYSCNCFANSEMHVIRRW